MCKEGMRLAVGHAGPDVSFALDVQTTSANIWQRNKNKKHDQGNSQVIAPGSLTNAIELPGILNIFSHHPKIFHDLRNDKLRPDMPITRQFE